MKKWITLLLCSLLCLCVAGAMAETVTLNYSNGRIKLYPNGYTQRDGDFHPQKAATTQYVITGSITADSPLDIYLVPYRQEYATEDVVYNISFDGAELKTKDGWTAIRIGNNENDKAYGHTITLNLSNRGDSLVEAHNHPAISSEIDRVTVNIHNHWGKLTLRDRKGQNGAFRDNITLNVAGSQVPHTAQDLIIENTEESLTPVNSLEPTCETGGNLEYWTCNKCPLYFLDAYAKRVTTLDGVRLLALGHDLEKVTAKNPTYDQEGNIEHYRCTRAGCNKLFSDAKATAELTEDEVILPKLVRTDSLPQTGDSSHLLRWMAVLGACSAGLWCLRKRRV